MPGPHPARQVDELTERDAERRLVLAWLADVTGQRKEPEAARLLGAHRSEPVRTVGDDRRHACDRLDVVDDGRRRVQPGHRREGWTQPRLAAAALQGVEKCRLLAADIGAGAGMYHELEVV